MTTTAQPAEPPKAVSRKAKGFRADEKKELFSVVDFAKTLFSSRPRGAAGKVKDAEDKHPAYCLPAHSLLLPL